MLKISNYFIHKGEEKCISAGGGSGIIYFTGCNLKCCFCNIYKFSQLNKGYEINVEQFVELLLYFQNKGCNNINLCNMVNYSNEVILGLNLAKEKGLNIPILYNSSGYESLELLEKLNGLIDIYLVDYKYSDNKLAYKYSEVCDYVETFHASIHEMYKQTGKIKLNDNGILQSGIIIRHLILPGSVENSTKVAKDIYSLEFSDNIFVSLLNQYIPENEARNFQELNRKVEHDDFLAILNHFEESGLNLIE
jgi:putative pyruvate formate lyase activating enzyme